MYGTHQVMLKHHLFPLGISSKNNLQEDQQKYIFLPISSSLFFASERLLCWSSKRELALNQTQKGQCRVSHGPLWISVRLPHESCQTAQIQRSESQSRPSRFLGSSQRCSSRGSCHSACQRRNDPGMERDTPLRHMGKWSSEACCSMEGPPT